MNWIIALLQALTAVLTAVLIYVSGQVLVKLMEPMLELRAIIGRIAGELLMYASRDPRIASDEDRHKHFRRLASDVFEKSTTVLGYGLFARIGVLPKKADVEEAGRKLVSLSNLQFEATKARQAEENGDGYHQVVGAAMEGLWEVTVREIRQRLKITEPDPPSLSVEAVEEAIERGDLHL
jgi:hypothetical protein